MTTEDKLRDLNQRFESVEIYQSTLFGRWAVEAHKPLPKDSREYAPIAHGDTVNGAIDLLWRLA